MMIPSFLAGKNAVTILINGKATRNKVKNKSKKDLNIRYMTNIQPSQNKYPRSLNGRILKYNLFLLIKISKKLNTTGSPVYMNGRSDDRPAKIKPL